MAAIVDRSIEAREKREPDLFLSHSSRDKDFVVRLGEDLTFCEVDAWLDQWELQVGDSLHDVISQAMERSRFVAVVLGDNHGDSNWAHSELKQAIARERREERNVVLPLMCGTAEIPAFLEDKLYLDFRTDYYAALARLAAVIHNITRNRIEDAITALRPSSMSDCISVLRYAGKEPYVILGHDDWSEIAACGGTVHGERVRFSPRRIARDDSVSPRLRALMKRLIDEVWTD